MFNLPIYLTYTLIISLLQAFHGNILVRSGNGPVCWGTLHYVWLKDRSISDTVSVMHFDVFRWFLLEVEEERPNDPVNLKFWLEFGVTM